eukprot:TRINITY_DN74312_c0_g1_i1.p1 TRINITY_DN74312_c0_g1~~TRINITY_DN74312_c0_g1_i1.p1  ORF type:complete len:220 (+),score=40.22 TRINITY_DN74312_c0_g1_i1:122-781(+)
MRRSLALLAARPGAVSKAIQRGRESLLLFGASPLPSPWLRHDWCLHRPVPAKLVPRTPRIAAFDFDKTLHFGGGAAWRLSSAHVPARLRHLHEVEGYRLVVFSNQHAAGRQRTQELMDKHVAETVARFDDFVAFCGLPIEIFIAAARGDIGDKYRKPETGMWDLLCSKTLPGAPAPDPGQSFYVGNAAGRPTDFSNADREFANRAGLTFHTEEWLQKLG